MKETYLNNRLNQLEEIEHAYRLTNQLKHAVSKIQTPDGMQEPEIINDRKNVVIWLWYWPLEAACGFVTELEELIFATAIPTFDGKSQNVSYEFLTGTEFYFRIVCSSPAGCKWEGDPGKFEYEESKQRPKC